MNLPRQTLSFSLHDEVEGRPLSPENVDLLTLHQFMGEVIDSNPDDVSREIDEEKLKALWGRARKRGRVSEARRSGWSNLGRRKPFRRVINF